MDEKRMEDKGVTLCIDERITLISLTLNTVGAASNGVDQELEKAVVKEGVRGKEMKQLDKDECCVCIDAPKSFVFAPCGHRCACESCANDMMRKTRERPVSGLQTRIVQAIKLLHYYSRRLYVIKQLCKALSISLNPAPLLVARADGNTAGQQADDAVVQGEAGVEVVRRRQRQQVSARGRGRAEVRR